MKSIEISLVAYCCSSKLCSNKTLPNMTSMTTIHWDATRSLVQKCLGEGPIYYYATVLPHPVTGKAPLAVAEMITNSHNVPNHFRFPFPVPLR